MMGAERPALWLTAGPNGVGMTSYARRYLHRRIPCAYASFGAYAAACDLWCVLDTQLAEPRLVADGPPPAIADAALLAGLPALLRA